MLLLFCIWLHNSIKKMMVVVTNHRTQSNGSGISLFYQHVNVISHHRKRFSLPLQIFTQPHPAWVQQSCVLWQGKSWYYDKKKCLSPTKWLETRSVRWENYSLPTKIARFSSWPGPEYDFPHYWPFVRAIRRSPVKFPDKGQWRGALMFALIYAPNGWVNNRDAGD